MMTIVINKLRKQNMSNKGISKFSDYKNFFLNNEIKLKPQQRFKNEEHSIYILKKWIRLH